MAGVAGLISCY